MHAKVTTTATERTAPPVLLAQHLPRQWKQPLLVQRGKNKLNNKILITIHLNVVFIICRKIAVVSPTANVANAASLGVGASFGAAALSQHPILHPRKGHSSRRPDDAVDSVVTRVQQAYAQASSSSSSARKGRDIETRAKEGEDCDGNNHRGVAVGGGGFESYDNEDSDSVREMAAELQLLVKGVEFRWGDSNDEEQQQQQQVGGRKD